jgi:carbonic anhydrase/acetyltransferase-like protein (isoleucine patch superfamily)
VSEELERSMARARDALTRPSIPRQAKPAFPSEAELKAFSMVAGATALFFIVLGLLTGQHEFIKVGMVLAVVGVASLAGRRALQPAPGVGMGATVARDAILDGTASVDMGATISAGAQLREQSVVRMGASVGKGAVLERGATVSWGVSIGAGAVIGEGATVGAGSHVLPGARVPAGMSLSPGTTYGAKGDRARKPQPQTPADPRVARVEAACDKLAAELGASPDSMREVLGDPGRVIVSLRGTCADLLRRESELRRESDTARLDQERAAIAARAEAEKDVQIRESLHGALQAIDGQKQQRESLHLTAERLAAEHTRLLYTLEHLAVQFVRMRSAGADATRAPQELQRGVAQLRDELDAIADALESVNAAPPSAMTLDSAVAPPDATDASQAKSTPQSIKPKT